MILCVMRAICLLLTIYGCLDCSMPAATNDFIINQEGGRYRYLTNIGLYLCVISMTLGMIRRKVGIKLIKQAHTFLASVSLPINLTVFIIYWPILFHNVNHFRRLEVYLKGGVVSTFTDLCQHVVPEIGVILDVIGIELYSSVYHRYFLIFYGIAYYIFCIKVSMVKGLWPYPFLERLSFIGRFAFYLSIVLISLGVYEIMMRIFGKKQLKRSQTKVKIN